MVSKIYINASVSFVWTSRAFQYPPSFCCGFLFLYYSNFTNTRSNATTLPEAYHTKIVVFTKPLISIEVTHLVLLQIL